MNVVRDAEAGKRGGHCCSSMHDENTHRKGETLPEEQR